MTTSSHETNNIINQLNPWWHNHKYYVGKTRKAYRNKIINSISDKNVMFLFGPRRVGKTTLIFQTIHELINSGDAKNTEILFLSLDNPALDNIDLQEYLISETTYKYVFLDEIQYRNNWQVILKAILDNPSRKFNLICSGSASSLISDTSSYLTGRSKRIIVNPLSYPEYKEFTNLTVNVEDYLKVGGYPEFVEKRAPNYHADLFRDVVMKDIVSQFNVSRSEYFYEICNILARQVGFGSSYSKISNVTDITDDTVKTYIEYLTKAYLIDSIQKYSPSINDRIYSARKYYFYDVGMRNSFVGFEDIGSLIENVVYLSLKERYPNCEIYYLRGTRGQEVDFVLVDKKNVTMVEVKYSGLKTQVIGKISSLFYKDIYELSTKDRIVVTKSFNEEDEINGKHVKFISLDKFLTEQ